MILSFIYEQFNNTISKSYIRGKFVMRKRNETSRLTRECITTALLLLSEEKDYDDITITDITEKAGVSRMAYYRHYKSKDEIIVSYLADEGSAFAEYILSREHTLRDILMMAGNFFSDNVILIKAIIKANLINDSMRVMTDIFSGLFPVIKTDVRTGYATGFYIGAITSVFRIWLESGMHENVEQIVDFICENIGEKVEQEYYEFRNKKIKQ